MIIRVMDVSKRYDTRSGEIVALDAVNLGICEGEFVSIIGPSGCGKSTLLMIVSGLTSKSSGSVQISGGEVTTPYTACGIVFQQDVLLDWRSAFRNVTLQAEIRGMNIKAAEKRAHELLSLVGLEGFENMYPHELSGGMRQRVSICRALLHDPALLLMDEPFGALDALTRDQLNVDLLRFWQQTRMTVLFVTHSISEAVFLSDRVVVMSPRPGRVEGIIPINLPRPRRLAIRQTAEFNAHVQEITSIFKKVGVLRDE
jgi:NitT/TauT family transport system ATP-binding protein